MYLVLIFWRSRWREQGSWKKPIQRVVCDGNMECNTILCFCFYLIRQHSQMLVSAQRQETQICTEFIQIARSVYLSLFHTQNTTYLIGRDTEAQENDGYYYSHIAFVVFWCPAESGQEFSLSDSYCIIPFTWCPSPYAKRCRQIRSGSQGLD